MSDQERNLDTLIIDSSATMVVAADRDGRIIRFNEAGTRLLGYEKSEAMGKVVWELLPPPELRERARQRFAMMMSGQAVEFETVWVTKSGERKSFSYVARGVAEEDKEFAYMIGSAVDITARVKAETALRDSERRFRTTFDDAAIGMALVDENGRYLRVNHAFCQLTGYCEAELYVRDLASITHPDDRLHNIELFHQLLAGEVSAYVLEKRYIRRNGEVIDVQVSASMAGGEPGHSKAVVGIFENVSARRAAQKTLEEANLRLKTLNEALDQRVTQRTADLLARTEELARSEQNLRDKSRLLRSILDSMGDGVMVSNRQGQLVLMNPAAARLREPMHHENENIRERALLPHFFHADGVTRVKPEELPLLRSAAGEAVDDMEMLLRRPGRPEIWTRCTARPLLDESGGLDGAVVVIHDATERKRHEAEVRQTQVALENANQLLRQSEEHYRLLAESNLRLAREVEHRVRNNLQGLLGLMAAMRGRTNDLQTFAEALEARMTAMRHVHELLARTQWTAIELRQLAEGTLSTLAHLSPCPATSTRLAGPDVQISPAQISPLNLLLAEWFTNSCKYGAHSVPGGSLEVRWEVIPQSQPRRIRLTWTERGGPPVPSPVVPSLGTELVRGFARKELKGTVEMSYPPAGAEHALEFDLKE